MKVSLTLVSVIVVTFLVFGGTLQHDFVNFDDGIYVYENLHIQTLSWENVRWLFSNIYYTQYIPVTMFSHAVDYAIWNSDPRGHHLTNVILHSVNAGWVFLLGLISIGIARPHRSVTASPSSFFPIVGTLPFFGSVVAALFFSLHPLRAESVAWVSDRKDLLCTMFLAPSLIAYIRYASLRDSVQAKRWYVPCFVLFLLALLSKSVAVVAPVLFLLFDYLLLPAKWRKTHGRTIAEKIPFLISAASAALILVVSAPHAKVNVIVSKLTGFETILFPFYSLFFYLQKMVFPVDLAPLYPSVGIGTMVFAFAIVVGTTAACIMQAQKNHRLPILAWATFVIIQIPAIVSVFSGNQPFADRYSYLATISLCLLAGGWLEGLKVRIAKPVTRSVLLMGSAFVLVVLGVLTIRQAGHWQNSETLWTYVLANDRGTIEYLDGYVNLGQAYVEGGKHHEAKAMFRKAIALDSTDADAYYDMAYAYYYLGQVDTAMNLFRKTIVLDSIYAKAFYNIGIIHLKMNNQNAALDSLKKAARLGYVDAQGLLSKHSIAW